MPKNATKWITNPASTLNQRAYDSTVIYDTTVTYDGNVAGKSLITTKLPAVWSNATKTATAWYANSAMATIDVYDNTTDSYDGGGTISAFDSFDGIASGQSSLGIKKATVWANT